MPTNLLILEPQENNKAEAPGILFISLNMIFMPFYLKLHYSVSPSSLMPRVGCGWLFGWATPAATWLLPCEGGTGPQVGVMLCSGAGGTVTSLVSRKGQR